MKKILCIVPLFLFSCIKNPFVENAQVFFVRNETNKNVVYLVSKQYPDTSIPDNYNGLATVPAGMRTPQSFRTDSWDKVFSQFPSDTISVFIISSDTLAAYNWQAIRSAYKIIKRYDLSRQDLERMSYEIIYR